jgi:hypothetical protein
MPEPRSCENALLSMTMMPVAIGSYRLRLSNGNAFCCGA